MKDAGSGLSAQDIPKLFNKFARSHPLASKNYSGSGLGLAICKRWEHVLFFVFSILVFDISPW